MICSQCGHQNDDNMKFCTNCGNVLQASEAPVAEQVAPTPEPAPAYQPAPQPAPMPQYTASQPTYQQPQPNYQPTYQQFPYQQSQQQYQYQYQQPMYQPPVYAQPQAEQSAGAGKPLGIVGMVLGILSLVFEIFTIGYASDNPMDDETWSVSLVLSLIFAIAGLVLSIVGKSIASRRGCGNGPAVAGIVCSAIGLGFWIVTLIAATSMYDSYYYDYDYYYDYW